MGTIYLVRHGQAAFGTDDYDRLTETGFAQARLLGERFVERGLTFAATYSGTLRRHTETLEGILEGMRLAGRALAPVHESHEQLNEYNPEAVVAAFSGAKLTLEPGAERRDPQLMRQHFRVLRDALIAWAEGRTVPQGMPAWVEFQRAAVAVLTRARTAHSEGAVLIVSSGGPIAALVSDALQAPPSVAIDLNLRVRNSGVTEFATSAKRHHLVGFNSISHLETVASSALVTFA